MSGSVRDNITFGIPLADIDHNRLEWVIDACGLKQDIAGMKQGLE